MRSYRTWCLFHPNWTITKGVMATALCQRGSLHGDASSGTQVGWWKGRERMRTTETLVGRGGITQDCPSFQCHSALKLYFLTFLEKYFFSSLRAKDGFRAAHCLGPVSVVPLIPLWSLCCHPVSLGLGQLWPSLNRNKENIFVLKKKLSLQFFFCWPAGLLLFKYLVPV